MDKKILPVKVYDEDDVFTGYTLYKEETRTLDTPFFVKETALENWLETKHELKLENFRVLYFNFELSTKKVVTKRVLFDGEKGIIVDSFVKEMEWGTFRNKPKYGLYVSFYIDENVKNSVIDEHFRDFFMVETEKHNERKIPFSKHSIVKKYIFGLRKEHSIHKFRCDMEKGKIYFEFSGSSEELAKSVSDVKLFLNCLYDEKVLTDKTLYIKLPSNMTQVERFYEYFGTSPMFELREF